MAEKIRRPHEIQVHVTEDANAMLRGLAKRYRIPIAAVARGMMQAGAQPWIEKMKAAQK